VLISELGIKEWQQRPLDKVYFIVWMDGIVFKIRHNGKVINKTIYLMIGVNRDGYKEVLGMWINETESASFWLNALKRISRIKGSNCSRFKTWSPETLVNFHSQTLPGCPNVFLPPLPPVQSERGS